MQTMKTSRKSYDPARRREGVRRTVWICVIFVVVLLLLFWAEHLWQ